MINTLVFDFGGVLLRTESHAGRHKWDDKLGFPHGSVEEAFFNNPHGRQAQHGLISTEQRWTLLGEQYDLTPAELATLRYDFWAGDVLDQQLVARIRDWKTRYTVAMISNAMDDLRTVLASEFAIADVFDLIVISAEEGVMKPTAAIYERTLDRLGIPAHTAVFIDDFTHNLDGAHAVGMATVHFTPQCDLTAEFAKLGIR